jgi:hypothetical protein
MKWRKALSHSIVQKTWRKKGMFMLYPLAPKHNFLSFRRLLYVACTRAQGLLYLTYATSRKIGGVDKSRELTSFVASCAKLPQACSLRQPGLFYDPHDRFFSLSSRMICQNFPPLTEILLPNLAVDQHLRNQKSQRGYLNCESCIYDVAVDFLTHFTVIRH